MERRAERARQDELDDSLPSKPVAQTLTAPELDFRADPPKQPRQPIDVLVWLRVDGKAIRVPAECLQFTSRAALVRYTPPGQPAEQAWVWAGAVTRR